MFADDQDQEQNQIVKIGRLRMAMSSRAIFSKGGGNQINFKTGGVMMKGSYRFHSGRFAKSDSKGRLSSHIQYAAGQRRDQIEKGQDKDRQLYTKDGQKIGWKDAAKQHDNAFIEHRIIMSPAGNMSEKDIHTLAQATIKEVQSRHVKAEITSSYAIHSDTDHRHAHIILTSPNMFKLDKKEYRHLRAYTMEMRQEMEHGQHQTLSQSATQTQEQQQTQQQEQIQQQDQGQERMALT